MLICSYTQFYISFIISILYLLLQYLKIHIITKMKILSPHQINPLKHFKQINIKSTQKSFQNDSLFASKRQKQSFLQQLRRGTLFKWSNHIKAQPKKQQKIDPYVDWLNQNSLIEDQSIVKQRKMGETFFYLNTQEIDKQKKCIKNTLPKIQRYKNQQNHTNIKKGFSLHIFNKKSKYKEFEEDTYKCKCKCSNFRSTQKQTSKVPQKSIFHLNVNYKSSTHKNHKNHKNACFQNKLNKTQFLQKLPSQNKQNLYQSFYSNKQNLVKSNLFLNDHKYYPYGQTFYTHKKTKLETDYDLQRVSELKTGSKYVKPIQKNLQNLQKHVNHTCYNQLSTYFLKMKQQVNSLLLQQNKNQKKQQKQERQSSLSKLKLDESIIETKQQQRLNNSNLPAFLLKTLSSFKSLKQPQQNKPQTTVSPKQRQNIHRKNVDKLTESIRPKQYFRSKQTSSFHKRLNQNIKMSMPIKIKKIL